MFLSEPLLLFSNKTCFSNLLKNLNVTYIGWYICTKLYDGNINELNINQTLA